MLKKLPVLVVLFLLAVSPALADYSEAIEDLPLMPGMVEKKDDVLIFDKPDGRIVETSIETDAPPAEVKKFYEESLPPLGWHTLSLSLYAREDETLKIKIERKDETTLVRFVLKPKGK
jgi:hypothetical protein